MAGNILLLNMSGIGRGEPRKGSDAFIFFDLERMGHILKLLLLYFSFFLFCCLSFLSIVFLCAYLQAVTEGPPVPGAWGSRHGLSPM